MINSAFSVLFVFQVIRPKGQRFPYNRWEPHNNEKAEGLKQSYDPKKIRDEAAKEAKKKAKEEAKAQAEAQALSSAGSP